MEIKDAMTLGELIKAVEKIAVSGKADSYEVWFDFGSLVPTNLDSWRGVYEYLALGYAEASSQTRPPSAKDFLQLLLGAVGKQYQGYKGGAYVMSLDTPVFVANPGHAGDTGVVAVRDNGYYLILETGRCWD